MQTWVDRQVQSEKAAVASNPQLSSFEAEQKEIATAAIVCLSFIMAQEQTMS